MGGAARMRKRTIFLAALLMAAAACMAGAAKADETTTPAAGPGSFLEEHFSYDVRVLSFGVLQQPTNSTQNPSNNFLQLQRYLGDGELRPDLRLSLGDLDLSVKPRARLDYSAWEDGTLTGESQWDHDFFVNEWLARLKVRENLFVSYGRENLQWGPSYLFSPSNPFFQDNGRRNTFLEVPGMDFARLVWIPGAAWSLSFIANTDPGLNKTTGPGAFLSTTPPPPFERTYTVKADYTGREAYASLILSRKQDDENVLGFFGGWTATDAILLYAEGALTQGSTGLYPVEERFSPFGASMETVHTHDSAMDPTILLGASYTFESKGILSLEYAYYGPGYGERDTEDYYALRRRAAQSFTLPGPIAGLAMETLGQTADIDLRFLRKNYAMLQYTQTNIRNKIDLTFRWTQNLDDGSGQFFALASYDLGKHVELFSAASFMAGGKNTEFGSVLDYQVMLGLEYTF